MIVLNVYWAYKNFVKQWRVVWVVTLSEEEENDSDDDDDYIGGRPDTHFKDGFKDEPKS